MEPPPSLQLFSPRPRKRPDALKAGSSQKTRRCVNKKIRDVEAAISEKLMCVNLDGFSVVY